MIYEYTIHTTVNLNCFKDSVISKLKDMYEHKYDHENSWIVENLTLLEILGNPKIRDNNTYEIKTRCDIDVLEIKIGNKISGVCIDLNNTGVLVRNHLYSTTMFVKRDKINDVKFGKLEKGATVQVKIFNVKYTKLLNIVGDDIYLT